MKRFMYLSIAMLCLALTLLVGFHLGSRSVQAQAPEPINGYRVFQSGGSTFVDHFIMLSNGDVFRRQHSQNLGGGLFAGAPTFVGNFWTGATVPTSESTWGSVKDAYKK